MNEQDIDIIELFIAHICPDWSFRVVGNRKHGWVEIYNEDNVKIAEVDYDE